MEILYFIHRQNQFTVKGFSLFSLLLSLFTISCSTRNNNIPEAPYITCALDDDGQEYGISKEIQLESFTSSMDTNYVAFCGHTDNKLWIACFEKNSKKKLLEWTDDKPIQTKMIINTGNGESKKFTIYTRSFSQRPYFNQNTMIFLLSMSNSIEEVASNLYFLKNNQLQQVFTSQYPFETSDYKKIHGWYNSIITENMDRYECYTENGEILYSIADSHLFSEKMEPINYYEGIDFNLTDKWSVRRVNLKDNIIVWENKISPISDLKVNNTTLLKKDNNIWTYAINYSLNNGIKETKEIKLDINTGKYK